MPSWNLPSKCHRLQTWAAGGQGGWPGVPRLCNGLPSTQPAPAARAEPQQTASDAAPELSTRHLLRTPRRSPTAITDGISPLSSPGGPGEGSPGRAARGRVPAHSIISHSGSSSLATQTEPQHGLGKQIHRRRHCSSGGEPGVPTAGRCHCPALPWGSTRRPSSLAGQTRRRLCYSVSSRA